MKKVLMIVFAACVLGLPLFAQEPVSGTWHGQVELPVMRLNLVFHFGDSLCVLDSPDQGAEGLGGELRENSGGSVHALFPKIGAAYTGRLEGGRIVGTFRQMGREFPLVLSPGGLVRRRPQTPVGPLPYDTLEVSFTSFADAAEGERGDTAVLSGTLTLPVGISRSLYESGRVVDVDSLTFPPCVLMVSGSGLQNRDEELFGHRPFAVLADYLARHGIASLRYDDRGFGRSTGDVAQATTLDFARDASAGLDFLRSMSVTAEHDGVMAEMRAFPLLGIVGHSEGGSIAFMLGAKGEAGFIVCLSAPGIKGDTLLVEQTNALLRLSNQPATMTLKQMRLMMVLQETNPWYDFFMEYDPTEDIASVKCPVMALGGSLDTQVLPESNLEAIRRLLPEDGGRNVVRCYSGLNHMFQHATTGATTEYGTIEETLSEEVLADIVEWIRQLRN